MRDLEAILHRIDGRGYKAYKEIEGRRFRFENFDLLVEHVQGDPYAAASKLRALVPVKIAAQSPGNLLPECSNKIIEL